MCSQVLSLATAFDFKEIIFLYLLEFSLFKKHLTLLYTAISFIAFINTFDIL